MKKLLALFERAGLGPDAVAAFRDVYEIGPWPTPEARDTWAEGIAKFVESLLATKPKEEVREFLEIQARRADAMAAGNAATHAKAMADFTSFLKAKTG